jgi:predicted acyl esterase
MAAANAAVPVTTQSGGAATRDGVQHFLLQSGTPTITALDRGWIAVLYDVAPEAEPEAVTAGWLRASMSRVNEEDRAPGAPALDCREPIALAVGKRHTCRSPVVPNARRIAAGHRLRIVLASADEEGKTPTILGLTHTPYAKQASTPSTVPRVCCCQFCPHEKHRTARTTATLMLQRYPPCAQLPIIRRESYRIARVL